MRRDGEATLVSKFTCFILVVGSLLVGLSVELRPATARASTNAWSVPKLLYQTSHAVGEPAVVTDRTGAVHVFWVTRLSAVKYGEETARIYYTRSRGSSWSTPTDVIAMSGASAPSAAVDRQGLITLVWHGVSGDSFRSQARVERATAAASWDAPVNIGPTNNSSDVIADSRGGLHLVYVGPGGSGVFYQSSDDNGQTWSFPVNVSSAGPDAAAEYARMAVAPDGTIHVVWTEFQLPNGWPPLGVYYARSTDGGTTWSPALQIAERGFTQGNVTAGPRGVVYIAWNGMSGVQGRYSRQSLDGGITWSAPSLLKPPMTSTNDIGGSTGPPGLVVDSAGHAHVLFVQDNRVWYSAWHGSGWTIPQYVPSGDEAGLPAESQPISGQVRHIEQAVMALGLGDQLHVVFWDVRPAKKVTYVWYTAKSVDAPRVTPASYVAAPAAEKNQVTDASTIRPVSAQPAPDLPLAPASEPAPVVSHPVLILGALPIAVVLAGLTAVRVWTLRR